ncbi:MAG: hypothetical protein HY738_12090 [Bacteroidia bacterium]|nr:hypothetical protein [Bacteroidia bacterium]
MQVASIELYDLLKIKIGEAEAKTLVTFIEQETENKFEQKKDTLVAELETKMAQLETRLTRSIYMVGLIQYLAMLVSLIAIIKYLM